MRAFPAAKHSVSRPFSKRWIHAPTACWDLSNRQSRAFSSSRPALHGGNGGTKPQNGQGQLIERVFQVSGGHGSVSFAWVDGEEKDGPESQPRYRGRVTLHSAVCRCGKNEAEEKTQSASPARSRNKGQKPAQTGLPFQRGQSRVTGSQTRQQNQSIPERFVQQEPPGKQQKGREQGKPELPAAFCHSSPTAANRRR